jgi:predicted ATPase
MKLDFLTVEKFKNLRDFQVDFDENPNELFTVLLGRNGLGKSNLLEVLVVIFRDLFLGAETDFGYELRYTLGRGEIRVTIKNQPAPSPANGEFSLTVTKPDTTREIFTREQLKTDAGKKWLPRHVFAYYSGPSDRLEQHFRPHQKAFYKDLLKGKEALFRPLFYARPVHSNFVLLAFFTKKDDVIEKFLRDRLRIEGLETVLFVLRKPKWKGLPDGDPRFWKAAGTVKKFLSKLWDISLAPMLLKGKIAEGLDKPKNTEFRYLHLRDLKGLQDLAEKFETPADFFKELESTYMSSLIHETRIRVRVRQCDGPLTFRELSEGEQQLLMVVGLLRFTKEEESIFLLDEPDTHLNPAWGMEYLEILKEIAEPGNDSQIVIATHDPLMLAGLRKEQVVVLDRNIQDGTIVAYHPEIDPQGMGVSGILRSSMFGLQTTLDLPTQKKLNDRFDLVAKGGGRTPEENTRLRVLTDELATAGFADDFRDANYSRYARALGRVKYADRVTLTPEQIAEIDEEAVEAVRQILSSNPHA